MRGVRQPAACSIERDHASGNDRNRMFRPRAECPLGDSRCHDDGDRETEDPQKAHDHNSFGSLNAERQQFNREQVVVARYPVGVHHRLDFRNGSAPVVDMIEIAEKCFHRAAILIKTD